VEDFLKQIESIRRAKWLVVGVGVIALLSALILSLSKESTYTASAAVTVGSATQDNNRSPDQDAVLARSLVVDLQGNQGALRDRAKTPDDVSIELLNVASGPIVSVAATASNPDVAVTAATEFAKAWQDEVLAQYGAIYDTVNAPAKLRLIQAAKDLALVDAQLKDTSTLSAEQIAELAGRQQELQATRQGLLVEIKALGGGVTNPNLVGLYRPATSADENRPKILTNSILGLIGGLVLGSAIALILGALTLRLSSPETVRSKLKLPTLATVSQGDARRRAEDLKTLASGMALMSAEPRSVAVTSPSAGEGKSMVASNLARNRAALGDRVILIDANLRATVAVEGRATRVRPAGLSALLSTDGDLDVEAMLVDAGVPNLKLLAAGPSTTDPYSLVSEDRMRKVLEFAEPLADLVVIDTPALLTAAECQVVCSLADQTILVIDAVSTQTADAVEARDLLDRVHANVLGVVLTRVRKRRAAPATT
jgi:polysaccharide biosynthesis transport protein